MSSLSWLKTDETLRMAVQAMPRKLYTIEGFPNPALVDRTFVVDNYLGESEQFSHLFLLAGFVTKVFISTKL